MNPTINTCETQPLCHDCKRPWEECPNTTVHALPLFEKGTTAVRELVWICEDCRNQRLDAHTYWCYKHKRMHTKAECDGCIWYANLQHPWDGHFSAPVPKDAYVDFRGWRFTAPFICMGCGVEVDIHQWCFSRSCGPCDMSVSQTRRVMYRQCFAGPHEKLPTWKKGVKQHGDIKEEHFIDPARRLEFPLMYPQLKRAHDGLEKLKRERYGVRRG